MNHRHNKTGLIILAGGRAQRMGSIKQLALVNQKTLFWHLISRVPYHSLKGGIFLITGAHHDCLKQEFNQIIDQITKRNSGSSTTAKEKRADTPHSVATTIFRNYAHREGQLETIKAGLRQAKLAQWDGALVLPSDIPFVATTTYEKLITEAHLQRSKVMFPSMNNRCGHPVYIHSSLFDNIIDFNENGGLREFFRRMREEVHYMVVSDEAIFYDLDTPGDLKNAPLFLNRLKEHSRHLSTNQIEQVKQNITKEFSNE